MKTRATPKSSSATVLVAATTANEIIAIANGVGRSVAFVVERALGAAKLAAPVTVGEAIDDTALVLAVDGDDPADLIARITKRARGLGALDVVIEAAWQLTRARFFAWMEREQVARRAEVADELDVALAAARSPATSTEQLAVLGASVYPRVRALVAAHAATDAATLLRLTTDREPYVRDAVENRGLGGNAPSLHRQPTATASTSIGETI